MDKSKKDEVRKEIDESSSEKLEVPRPKKDRIQLAADILKKEYGIDLYTLNKSRKYKLQKAAEYLKCKYDIKLNDDTKDIEIKHKNEKYFEVMDDQTYRYINTELDMEGIELSDNLYKNLLSSGFFFERYTPIKDFLFSLPVWDRKTDYIRRWLEQVQLIDEEKWRAYFVEGFKRWFTALVMSLVEDRISLRSINHTCLIFQGPQSAGKSTFIENLIPERLRLQYLQVGNFNFHLKEDQKYLGSKILIDLAELSAMTRADNEAIKARITQQHFSARLPWGKADTRLKRRASFCGSTNDEQFLTDITGDRRFLCVPISKIYIDESLDVHQLYSQALALYKDKTKWWFDNDDIKKIGEMNEEFRLMTQEEEYILSHFSVPTKEELAENKFETMMTKDISQWLCKKYERLNDNSTVKKNLGKALAKHNFNKVSRRMNGKPLKLWQVVLHDIPTEQTEDEYQRGQRKDDDLF